ncbi:Alstrom syndrome protein 1 isoform X1 [Mustela erminea]|uniref:Alstrom syndrome protein 1 isoform X1 n=2 Tax=Mustela erminea TaxID=36723 RepID=UPI00138739E6|nr:Alstrom syndrome protein 1 isoform X1 [Mustela erminea]
MEPEDLPWPGELEEEEEEEEETEEAEERANLDSDEVVMVEEVEEEERRYLDLDFSNYESQPPESTDDEEDEEAKAWLQAHPVGPLPPSSVPRHRYSEDQRTGPEKVVPLTCHVWQQPLYQGNSRTQIPNTTVVSVEKTVRWRPKADQRTECWQYLPQEMDSSHTLDITQTGFNMREEGTEVTDLTSVEEGILTQPENQGKESKRGLLCSPLLVIQDNFASPDLPLLTCMTQDQEFGSDSLFQRSEPDFAPLRGIPGKSEDTEWFSRPSEVSEALFQAASEVASDLVNSCISVSQHSLIASTTVECRHSFLPFEQGIKEETPSSDTVDELKTPNDFDSCDALCSYMAWKTQEVQEPEVSLADKGQVSVSTSSYTSDEYMTPEGSDSFDASCSYVQYWKQKALQQSENYLTSKDHDSYSDSSDTIDKNKIPKGSDSFHAPFSCTPWSKRKVSHHPETYVISKDYVSFPHEVAPHFNNRMSHSFLHCLLERRGKGIPLTAHNHYFGSVYLRAPAENEVKEMMGYERIEEGLEKELSQGFEQKESRSTSVFPEMHARSSEIKLFENVVFPDNSVKVSEIDTYSRQHGTSKMEVSGGPLKTIKFNLDETSEQPYLQEERYQRAASAFGGNSVDASENVAFEVVIASIEPSKKDSTVNEIQTDISKSLINDSQECEPKNSHLSLLNYNGENSLFDELSHPLYQSTPGVFELAASKPLLHKKDNSDSSLYWHLDLKSLPSAPQEMFIKPLSLIPELKSSASLSEKSHSQAAGLGKAQSALFHCDLDNEPFLPIGKIKSGPDLDLAEKAGSSNIFYPMKVSTSDSLVLQDLRRFEEIADSSNDILVKNGNSSNIIEGSSASVGGGFSANLVTSDAESQGALSMTSNASLIPVGQESLLKADVGQDKIPQPMGAKSYFTIHTVMQNDSYFVEGLQGKAESDTSTLGDDIECCDLDENATVGSTRAVDLQREVCEQGDLTVECIELAGFKNVLDDLEVCDSSLHRQSALELPSKEESDFEEPVGCSNTDTNQTFSSTLPPFTPDEPTIELEYHSSDLRMLRVSPDTVQKSLKHIAGDTSKGGIPEVTHSSSKPGITATAGDSDTGSLLSLFPEDFPQLALRSPQENTIGQHTDKLNQQAPVDSKISEETLKLSAVSELADQKTEISTVPSSSYSQRGKPNIFYPQALPDSHLTEEALKVLAVPGPAVQKAGIPTVLPSAYSRGEKHNIFYQQAPPDSHLTKEALKVLGVPHPPDQKTSIPAVIPSSYSRREKHNIFYQQAPPDDHLTEETVKVSGVPGSPVQKSGIPTVLPSSYSRGEKHSIFYPQTLPDGHLTEETLKISAADQGTEKTIVPSSSYSRREKHIIFSQQQLSDGHLTKQVLKVSFVPGPADQNTGIPTLSSHSCPLGEKPSIFYQQVLPDSHLIEQTQKIVVLPEPADQKTRIPSTSYLDRERPPIFYQQTLPESHLTEQALKFSALGSIEQKIGIPTSTFPSGREKSSIFYKQELSDSHPIEQAQKVPSVPGPADQDTGIPVVPSRPSSLGEKPNVFYQQVLPDSPLTEETLKASSAPRPGDQKTGIPAVSSSSYSHREKPGIFYQKVLPSSHQSEEALKVSVASEPAEKNSGLLSEASNFYSHREKHNIFYEQELTDSSLTEQAQKVSPTPEPTDQKTEISTITSASYSDIEKPFIFYPQSLPDSHLPEEALKVTGVSEPTDQKTGIPVVPSTSYSPKEKPIFPPQALPGSQLLEEALKISAVSGPADQKTGLPLEPSSSYPPREKPITLYPQDLTDSQVSQEALKVSAVPGPTDQKTGLPLKPPSSDSPREKPITSYPQDLTDRQVPQEVLKVSAVPGPTDQQTGLTPEPSSSYSPQERPIIFSPQALPGSQFLEEALKVSAIPGPADQKTGLPSEPSSSYSAREKPIIFYPQGLTDGQVPQEALKVSSVPGPTDQEAGLTPEPSGSYSPQEKPIIFPPQDLPGSHLLEEALKISAVPGPADQKTGLPSEPSSSYSAREKPIIFYPQGLTDGQVPQEALKVSAICGPTDQKTALTPEPSSSYSPQEKPIIFSSQALPGSQLLEEALKISAIPGPADQKTGLPSEPSSSYSAREKPIIFYPQGLIDGQVPQETLNVAAFPGPADQKTGLTPEPSSSYSPWEKPIIFYPEGLTDCLVPQEPLKVSTVPGPTDQKIGLPSESSSSYSPREKPIIFYPEGLADSQVSQEALKVLAIPGPADQKTGLPSEPSSSYSYREKPIIFYPQRLTHSPISQEPLKVSAIPGPADQKTGLTSEPSSSYSYREKPIIFYPQGLADSQLPQEVLKVSAVPGPPDQKTGLPSVPSSSHSYREKPIIFYSQGLTDSRVSQEALKVSAIPGPVDQKVGLPSEPSSSYSPREKPIIFYPQGLTDGQVPQEALKVSAIPGPTDQKTGLTVEPSSSYSNREKSNIFYQQELLGSHLTEETLKVLAVSGTSDQKTGIPTVPSSSYSLGGKPIIFYQQALSDRPLTEEALNVSPSPGPADQDTGIPIVSSVSYSHREKPSILYQQPMSDDQLAVEALKISAVSGPDDKKTRKPTVTLASYSHRDKPIIYQQEFPDLTEASLNVFRVPGLGDQKTGIPVVTSSPYSHREKPIISYQQELPDPNEGIVKILGAPGSADQKTGIRFGSSASYSHRESPIFSYQRESPGVTEEALKVSAVSGPGDQKTGIHTIPSSSYSYREKDGIFKQQELPEIFALPGSADQKAEIPIGPSSSYSHKEKLKLSPVTLPDDQNTELLTAPLSSYSQGEEPKISTVIGPDNHTTPLLTVSHNSSSQRVKPSIFFQKELPDGHCSEDILKISPISEPTVVNAGIPIPLSSSYSHREKSNISYPQELPDKHLAEDALKVSTIPVPADQKSLLPTVPSSSFSHRQKPNIFYKQNFPDRHVTQDALMFSGGVEQVDQITGLSTVTPGTYSHSEKQKLVSDHVQMLIDNLDSSNSSVISNTMPLSSQTDGRVVISKPESSGFEDVGSEEIQDTSSSSKTLREIRNLLMEAENIALKRCNFSAPLVPFRDVNDISFIQSKKVVCFKEPLTADESNGDLPQSLPFAEESPSNKCIQKDISTQANLKCQRGIENWEFISSTTVRSPLQEAKSKARVTVDETLRQYRAAKSVMRSEPEGYSGTIGNKIVIPMMTIIKSDSSSDASSCSWDSNSLESVSDVLLNFFPYASPKASLTDSREEEGVLESDDAGGSSVDSLAAHVRNLLKCESSLNHAKQILRNAEEEECRVRARAWNLKFNLAHECGYSISELNEDDRRKVEEIKAKLFANERTTDLSKGVRSPRGIGCKPEAVCSHIIIESHEKGCFRTLTAEQPQLDSHPCVFRSADPSEMIRGQQSPSSWRTRHIDLSKSLDQSNPHFKVWNSLQLRSHSPFQNFTADDFRISQGLRMPFHEKIDPWLSELVEPASVPSEEMDCHSSSQMLPPEPLKKLTTSITFSSHRHSKCFSDSSVFKVGVTEGSQCTGASVGVFNSHFTEEQNPPKDLEQRSSSPSSFKIVSHSPDKAVTILAESGRQSQKLSVEHSQQEEELLERSDFKGSDSEPSTSEKGSNVKEVHFSDNHTFIRMSRPSSTLGVKEKNVTITPDIASHIILEQRELFEPSKASHADHHVRKHSPPPQHQDYIAPNLPCRIFLEKRELFERSKTPHLDHQMRENHCPFPQSQDYIASDIPSSIFLEQRQLFEQSKTPDVDHMGKYHSPLPQGQDYIVEKNNQHKFKSYISSMINVEAKFNNVVSQSAPNQCTLVTSASTPPTNRKALSCVRITLYPKTPSKLDSGTLDKRFHSLDPASKTRMNSEFNPDLQTISSRSLEPTSKLLTGKPVAQNQQSLGFLGPKSSPDFQVVQSPPPDSDTISQDLKTILFQNSQIVTSRQTQVNISDLEGYSSSEGTPVSADRPSEEIKTPFSAFPGKLSSDAVTQITTESPGKTMFSSEIFINGDDRGLEIPEPSTPKVGKVPVKFASSSSGQQITTHPHGTDGQPSLLPYKPPGSTRMYYVPQLKQIPPSLDSRSDTTIESSHSGSNDAIAPDFPAEVLGTRDDDLPVTDNLKHKEGIYSKRAKTALPLGTKPPQKDNADAQVQVSIIGDEDISDKKQKKEIYNKNTVTQPAQSEEKEPLQKTTEGSGGVAAAEHSARLQDTKTESLPDTEDVKQKEESHTKRTVPKEAWTKEKESFQIDIAESRCHSEFENTTHSVFRSAKFYFHHPVHLPSDQDFCHESLGRSVFMRHSWKDFFQHHPDKQREHTRLPSPHQNVEKTKADYTRIESLSINVNLENEVMHTAKSRARDYPKSDKLINDQKKDHKVTPEPTAQHSVSLNELWNKYQERQRQKKPPEFSDRKELSLVERLDRLAKLLQNPITYSLRTSESTPDDSRGEQDVKEWSGRQQQQKNKLQKKKRYKSLEKFHKTAGELKKSKVLSTHQAGKPNQIKIEQIKFDKYILRKQPGFYYRNNTSSDSRPSEESELLTDTPTNIVSTTTSPVESDMLTQTDREVTLHERSSSISTIDTARLIQAFGQERVCLSPRRIKLYSSLTDHQRRFFERRNKKNKKALNTAHPQMTSEHTRRKHIQVPDHVISSDSVSSSTSSFWSSSSTFGNKQNVQMLNKSIQAGNLEIVNGVKKHTRDVGMTFPTPSSSEARIEEDSDVTSWSEEKIAEKRLLANYLGDKKLRKNKHSFCEGVSWFVPMENVKSGPKENLPKHHGPGICWFAPITNTKPWREPLREQNWQGQHMDSHGALAGPGREPPKPFVRATLQESLQFHRPDFISRSGERIKRLKLIVQERKLQNMLQSEREALFNTVRERQGRDPVRPLLKRGFLDARKNRPIGKKEMIQRSKRIYEQLPEVQRKRDEEKRRLEYKSYRLRAQLFKKRTLKVRIQKTCLYQTDVGLENCFWSTPGAGLGRALRRGGPQAPHGLSSGSASQARPLVVLKVTNQLLGRKVPWN